MVLKTTLEHQHPFGSLSSLSLFNLQFKAQSPSISTVMSSFHPSKSTTRQSSGPQRSNSPVNSSLSCSFGPHQPTDVIELSSERKIEMLQLMEDSERHVVNSMLGDVSSLAEWKPHSRKKGIAYYVDDKVGKGLTRFCCVGVTDAPVPEIMKMFMVTNTEMLLKNVRIMYRNVKEARILSVLKPATIKNPMRSVYVRYASFETPALMSGRDICVCVCTNMLHLSDGSTVGYCLWDSVDLQECPDRFATDKIIRSKMWRSGYFFRNSGKPNAVTKVCYLIGVEIGGFAPQLTGRIYMTIFGGNCRRVCKHYRKRALDPQSFTPREKWTPKNDARYCFVCSRGFHPLAKKCNCVKCGNVVCTRCFFNEEVSVRGAVDTLVRICYDCLNQVGMLKTNLQAIAARESLDSFNSDSFIVRDLLRLDSTSNKSLPYWGTM